MEIIDAIKMVADLGVLIAIAGLFIYAAFRWIQTTLGGKDGGLPSKQARKEHDHLIDLRAKISEDIQDLIQKYQAKLDCDRLQVIEFSNSVMSIAYLPFRYMTCTYEVCRFGVKSTGHKIDRISTSLFTSFFMQMRETGWCKLDVTDNSTEICGAMKDWMSQHSEKISLNAEIATPSGKLIGYITAKNEAGFDEEDVNLILTLADQVSALLGVIDN